MRTFVFLASVLLAGCVSVIDAQNSVASEFTSPLSSEAAFRNVVHSMNECYPQGFTIASNYFPEAKEGEITLFAVSEVARFDYVKVTTKAHSNGTFVTLKRHSRYRGFEAAMPGWLAGTATSCPYGTRSEPRPPGSELNQNHMPSR
ncbi:hypothetical protein [Variovorax paradoxus]|uniref:Lipoprotein n=1 Tax=Variovorax paradoxus TaxID=34073 RepID=A0A679J8S3_VARPD|nr:hypothetical protein VVAX_03576 [Variovorax paradoxus]